MTETIWRPWDASRDAFPASDADREAAAETLRTHHTAGRLTDDEFQDRLERSMAAKTLGGLRALVIDLPDGSLRSGRREWTDRAWVAPLVPVIVVALFAALAAFARQWHGPWHFGMYRPTHHHWFPLAAVVIVAWAALSRRASRRWYGGQPD